MKQAYSLGSQNFEYLKVFIVTGLIYAAVSMPTTWLTVHLERRLNRGYR